MIKLSPRLLSVVRLAGSGESVIDVGTDHGYVPVWFVENGLFRRVAASDIHAGPLESAKSSARERDALGKIDFYLSDGLKGVPERFETVVIAGMGGETMVDILSSCPWIDQARLVLQPQSKLAELEAWLEGAGFVCEEAVLVEDAGKVYAAFRAQKGKGSFDLLRALTGDPLLPGCLERELVRLDRALAGLRKGAREDSAAYEKLSRQQERVENAIREVST